jgi:putative methionine-R-sulfoxide reductase with GAF domain
MSGFRKLGRAIWRLIVLGLPVVGGWLIAFRDSYVKDFRYAVVSGIALVALAILIQVLAAWRADPGEASKVFRVAMKDALKPLVRQISQMPDLTPGKRGTHLSLVGEKAAAALVQFLLPHIHDSRATVYRMESDGKALTVLAFAGRGEQPGEFRTFKGVGSQAALARVQRGETLIVRNMKKDFPEGWDTSRTPDYTSFVAVPIVDGKGFAYGMITVDSPKKRSFTNTDEHTVTVVAGLMAIAFALAYPQSSRQLTPMSADGISIQT